MAGGFFSSFASHFCPCRVEDWDEDVPPAETLQKRMKPDNTVALFVTITVPGNNQYNDVIRRRDGKTVIVHMTPATTFQQFLHAINSHFIPGYVANVMPGMFSQFVELNPRSIVTFPSGHSYNSTSNNPNMRLSAVEDLEDGDSVQIVQWFEAPEPRVDDQGTPVYYPPPPTGDHPEPPRGPPQGRLL